MVMGVFACMYHQLFVVSHGCVLGGSSTTNIGFYGRADQGFFAKFAADSDSFFAVELDTNFDDINENPVDIDVLVHGEPERNDMVDYVGKQLSGFAFTVNG
ncbi:hypothetical protein Ancab_012960 [Ancistrocladus abbreviatus]